MAQLLVKSKSWFASSPLRTVPVDARVDTMCTPGAVMSGWYNGSSGMPREEKSASTCALGSLLVGTSGFEPSSSMQWASEFVGSATPILQPAATPMTHGATLYGFNVFWSGPSLPAAKTTVIPRLATVFVASLIGSCGSNAPLVPQELFTTLMLYCCWWSKM